MNNLQVMPRGREGWFNEDFQKLAKEFVAKVAPKNQPFEKRLGNLLRARGFLIETSGEDMFLSDNSCNQSQNLDSDAYFLNKLLTKYDLGSLNKDKICLGKDQSEELLVRMFLEHGGVGGFGYTFADWSNFKRRAHGQKVPVYLLDPFVSRLVKAISSAGVGTHYSCDGHGKNKLTVGLSGKYNRAWFQVILDIVRFVVDINSRFSINHQYYLNVFDPNGDVLALYEDVQSVSAFLYDQRKFFRDLKQKTLNSLSESMVGGLDDKALYGFFRSEAFKHVGFIAKSIE